MQGPIENALMLVSAGNAFLAGKDIGAFWPDAPTFRFMGLCEFRKPPSDEDANDYPLVAADPMAWFASLKPWCRGLRLHHAASIRGPNQQIDAPDRQLVAFVGGGPRWLIETVGPDKSELWQGFFRVGDRKAADQKFWLCTNIMQAEIENDDVEAIDLAVALSDLLTVLPEIEAYAREEKLDNFADCFARAREAATSRKLQDEAWVSSLRRYAGLNDEQIRVLQAVSHAWVFGGMGSWNDTGGGARYEELSERLFVALSDTVAGLANSTFPA